MKLRSHKLARSGFALKELIVVMVVLAVLAALAIVFMLKSKRGGVSNACAANLKQIYSAMALYAHDNTQKLPYAFVSKNDQDQESWDHLLLQYIRSAMKSSDPNKPPPGGALANKILQCPSDPLKGLVWGGTMQPRRSYAMPPHTMEAPNWPPGTNDSTGIGLVWSFRRKGNSSLESLKSNGIFAYRIDGLPDAKGTLLLTEHIKTNNIAFNSSGSVVNYTGSQLDKSINPQQFQNGQLQYLLVDGHVETLLPEQTVGPNGAVGTDAKKHQGMWTIQPGD